MGSRLVVDRSCPQGGSSNCVVHGHSFVAAHKRWVWKFLTKTVQKQTKTKNEQEMEQSQSAVDAFKNITLPTSVPKMVHLGASYTPGIHDVICQRGKKAFTHIGNRRLQILVNANRRKYFDYINNKASRSAIVTNIIDSIRKNGGRFVRLDTKRKLWLEMSDRISR